MRLAQVLFISLATAAPSKAAKVTGCAPFPASVVEFSGGFQQPKPPLVQTDFQASFVQHKWNRDVSHITAGYIVNSPSKNLVRVDQAYDGFLGSSLFDYANVTKDGLVDNILTTYSYNSSKPEIWRGYVDSDFPLFPRDLLVQDKAVFGNLATRTFIEGQVAAWDILYQGVIPVTVYVNSCNVVVGYDYFSPGLRTRVITEFFNIQLGV